MIATPSVLNVIDSAKEKAYEDSSGKILPKHCTFDGELTQGTTFVDGQYTYRYKQEVRDTHYELGYYVDLWNPISVEGWGVSQSNKKSTEPVTTALCTTINDKPIVSMSYTFKYSRATEIDLSSFDTSNIINMDSMLYGSQATNFDLSGFDASNVTNMYEMFKNNSATSGYARTQADADKFNATANKSSTLNFVVK